MCDTAERELICRSVSFGPVDPYTIEAQNKYGANYNTVRNSYAPGGSCHNSMPDNGYWNSHTVPTAPDWGWKWNGTTYVEPPGGDPKGMIWNGKNFVQGPIPEPPAEPEPPAGGWGFERDGDFGREGQPVREHPDRGRPGKPGRGDDE